MAKQGCSFTEQEVKRIVTLLSETDMTIPEISQRMACSRSSVTAINRRFRVRKYDGLKKQVERGNGSGRKVVIRK